MTIRRFLSLWLPRLATDRARRLEAIDRAAPLAAVARVNNAERLVCVDMNAAKLGLTAGLSLADVRARHPALVAVQADPAEEARLLERLCDWCSRFTPLAALDGRDGLDARHFRRGASVRRRTGADRIFLSRLAALGVAAAGGAAGNPRAAWALARFSTQKIAPEPLSDKALARLFHDLPLAALGLDDKTVADMARAGLKRVGDIAFRPRAPITARFGAQPMARLDALKGLDRASIAPRFAAPDFCAERRFTSPVQTVEAIEASLRKLADDLVVLLERQAKGARRIELSLYRVDGNVRRILVGASRPLNEARAFLRLFAEKLASLQEEAIEAGFGVDLIRLSCLMAEPLEPSQAELERAYEAERTRALADLIDRLGARLGVRAVTRRERVEAHLPEQAERVRRPAKGRAPDDGGGRMRAKEARRRDRCGSSPAPSRSTRSPKCRTGRRSASAGGACCTTSLPSRAPSASPLPGGAALTSRRATISAPRITRPPLLALP